VIKIVALALSAALALALIPGNPALAQHPSLQERIDRASAGATLTVDGGVYRENIVIDKPLSLAGMGWPVIDGGGSGDVVTITADDVTLSGFTIRGSGRAFSQEPAAVRVVGAHNATITGNRIEDSHFGVHITESHHATITGNTIDIGEGVDLARQRHGVYLWQVEHSVVATNTIRNTADGIHLEFAHNNGIGRNIVEQSRYGLHLMYAHNNSIVGNTVRDNLAGAVLMFSHGLVLKDNEITNNREGATGAGILLKDVDDIFAEGNTVIRNKYGLTAEGTPQSVGATAIFMRNLFALNDTGLGMMSNSPIHFTENAMIENAVQVKALGGRLASALLSGHGATAASTGHADHAMPAGAAAEASLPGGVSWAGNYWSDYRGYDANGDGLGDQPYEPRPQLAGMLAGNDNLRLFQFTIAQQAIDRAAEMFPVFRYEPVLRDETPLMQAPGPALPRQAGMNHGLFVISALLVLLSAALLHSILDLDQAAVFRGRRQLPPEAERSGA
jgi:nitrous oxidase accessory protein